MSYIIIGNISICFEQNFRTYTSRVQIVLYCARAYFSRVPHYNNMLHVLIHNNVLYVIQTFTYIIGMYISSHICKVYRSFNGM